MDENKTVSRACFSGDQPEGDVRCARCEVVSPVPDAAGTLHLRFPVVPTLRKARRAVDDAGWSATEREGILSVDVPAGHLAAYARVLGDAFTTVERDAIRALFVGRSQAATLRDYLEADTLQRVIARARIGDIAEIIDGGTLTAAFQPIVDAQTLDVFAHEGLLRMPPDGPIAGPTEFFRIARDTDTLPNADLAARRTVIAAAGRQRFTGNLFINFMPSSIYDAASCLRSTIGMLDELGIAHERIIFEVVESDEVMDVGHLLNTLDFYRQAGFRVALDDLGSGFASLNLLHALKPDFIKLDLNLVRGVDRDPFKAMLAAKLMEAGRQLDLGVIAEGIESEAEWLWLRDHGASYVQGYFFGRPAPEMRAEVARTASAHA